MSSDFIDYKTSPLWADVTPTPQDEPGKVRTVVRIAYSARFSLVHEYLRSCMNANECSARVMDLIRDALDLNPANYSVWHYRRKVIEALRSRDDQAFDWDQEFAYITDMIKCYPKNYQVWYHRRWLVTLVVELRKSGESITFDYSANQELDLTADIFADDDSKNYHAWEHRQWAINFFQLAASPQELAFTEEMIEQDVRNNSAWNQRYFLLSRTDSLQDPAVVIRERDFSFKYIRLAPGNESAWNYLRGIFTPIRPANASRKSIDDGPLLCDFLELRSFAEEISTTSAGELSSYLFAFLFDWHRSFLQRNCGVAELREDCEKSFRLAAGLLDKLGLEIDRIRLKYWNYEKLLLSSEFGVFQKAE